MKKLLDKIKKDFVLGPFSKITDPSVIEIAGYSGFDFIIIDLEHGPISIENSQNLIRAAENVDISPIIRVANNDEKKILKALDIGAHGIQVPGISSKEQAERLVRYSYYAPKGERGVCRYVRAAEYTNINKEEYFEITNEQILTIAHIEGEEGIENLDNILEVDELDILFIGPYDLSQSMGIPGETENPVLQEKMREVVEACKAKNKFVGTFVETPEQAKKWKKAGVKYLSYSVDVGLIYNKFHEINEICRN